MKLYTAQNQTFDFICSKHSRSAFINSSFKNWGITLKKTIKIIILAILAVVFIAELAAFIDVISIKNKMWEGEISCISPDSKYILTVTSDHSNSFGAPYSIRIEDYGSSENPAYDFYIYECCEEPVVEWTENHILIKCLNLKEEEIVYETEAGEKHNEE